MVNWWNEIDPLMTLLTSEKVELRVNVDKGVSQDRLEQKDVGDEETEDVDDGDVEMDKEEEE